MQQDAAPRLDCVLQHGHRALGAVVTPGNACDAAIQDLNAELRSCIAWNAWPPGCFRLGAATQVCGLKTMCRTSAGVRFSERLRSSERCSCTEQACEWQLKEAASCPLWMWLHCSAGRSLLPFLTPLLRSPSGQGKPPMLTPGLWRLPSVHRRAPRSKFHASAEQVLSHPWPSAMPSSRQSCRR